MTNTRTIREGQVLVASHDNICFLKLVGDIRVTLCKSMDEYISRAFSDDIIYNNVFIDVCEADAIDSTSLGLLAKIAIHSKKKFGLKPTIFSTSPSITKLLNSVGFDQIFFVTSDIGDPLPSDTLESLSRTDSCCEKEERQRVIDLHKILMTLSDENKLAFKDLVSSLEKEN